MEIYVVEGFDPSDYDGESSPVRAFYDEEKAKEYASLMTERAQNLEKEMKKLYNYLDIEFPLESQDSIKQRSEYLKSTNALQEISDRYPDVPASCTMFDYYSLELE